MIYNKTSVIIREGGILGVLVKFSFKTILFPQIPSECKIRFFRENERMDIPSYQFKFPPTYIHK